MNHMERGRLCPSIAIGSAMQSVATALFQHPISLTEFRKPRLTERRIIYLAGFILQRWGGWNGSAEIKRW